MNIQPLGDRVLIKVLETEEITASGIVLPDSAKEKKAEGEVVAVGPGRRDDNGQIVPLEVKVGDRVLISKYGGDDVELEGVEYKIVKEDDVLAVVK